MRVTVLVIVSSLLIATSRVGATDECASSPCVHGTCAQPVLPLLSENFDAVPLAQPLSLTNTAAVWSSTPPSPWSRSQSVPAGGKPEYEGWTFVNNVWWISSEGNEDRSSFSAGLNTIAVADLDAYSSATTMSGVFAAKLSVSVDVSLLSINELQVAFSSAWKITAGVSQEATVTVEFSNAAGQVLSTETPLTYSADSTSDAYKMTALSESLVLNLNNPAGATSAVISFIMRSSTPAWFWAIDNIVMSGKATFECTCPQGYSDTRCSTNDDECASSPCTSPLTCADRVNAYACSCSSGLLFDYNMDGAGQNNGANVADSACSSANGVLVGPSNPQNSWYPTSALAMTPPNGFLALDGVSDHVTVPPTTIGEQTLAFTAWMRARSYSNWGRIIELGTVAGTDNIFFSFRAGIGRLALTWRNGGVERFALLSNTFILNEWTHVAVDMTADGKTVRYFQNGVLITTESFTEALPLATVERSVNYIGRSSSSSDDYMAADLSDVRVYTQALTSECETATCFNGGLCAQQSGSSSCLCVAGYTGNRCQTNINECASAPCQNGAVCLDGLLSYTCTCVAGYTGTLCESDIDECASSPCSNGATCTQSINVFICSCAPGFVGVTCQTNVQECASTPCTNGGTCVDAVNGFQCLCAGGYTGVVCETNLPECNSSPCQNEGVCIDGVLKYICECQDGFQGDSCEVNINDCASAPCQNGGSCLDGIVLYTCVCAAGFEGLDCSINIDECASSPCENRATCADKVNAFQCTCPPGYEGARCETDTDDCVNNPCVNGGSCTDLVDSFRCDCAAGYTGGTCTVNIDECNSSPCTSRATCVDAVNGFTCQCPGNFRGLTCELPSFCVSAPCQNQGVCIEVTDSFLCTCAEGFTGDVCETDMTVCDLNICLHGGTCVPLLEQGGRKSCDCLPYTSGLTCGVDCRGSVRSSDASMATLATCSTIGGDLVIDAASSLADLASVTAVTGSLTLKNMPRLSQLTHLAALTSVGGNLTIENNALLIILEFPSLETVGGDFSIVSNPALQRIRSMHKLASVGGTFNVRASPLLFQFDLPTSLASLNSLNLYALPQLVNLGSLTTILKRGVINITNCGTTTTSWLGEGTVSSGITSVVLHNNAGLVSLTGLEGLAGPLNKLVVSDNGLLASFPCASGSPLFAVDAEILISNNAALTSITCAFSSIVQVSRITVSANPALVSLSGFTSLSQGDVFIEGNNKLLTLAGSGLADTALTGAHTGDIVIRNNALLANVGLSRLTVLTGSLTLTQLPHLRSLSTPSLLTLITGNLNLSSNVRLASVSALTSALQVNGNVLLQSLTDFCFTLWDNIGVVVGGSLSTTGTSTLASSVACNMQSLKGTVGVQVSSLSAATTRVSLLRNVAQSNSWLELSDAETTSSDVMDVLSSVVTFAETSASSATIGAPGSPIDADLNSIASSTLTTLGDMLTTSSIDRLNTASQANKIAGVVNRLADAVTTASPCDSETVYQGGAVEMSVITRSTTAEVMGDYASRNGRNLVSLSQGFVSTLPTEACYGLQVIRYDESPYLDTKETTMTSRRRRDATTTARSVVSDVFTFSVSATTVWGLSDANAVVMALSHDGATTGTRGCYYWDATEKTYSTTGCSVQSDNATHTVCRCTHLTSFAVLATPSGSSTLSQKDAKVLEVLTYVGCIASMVCIALMFLAYAIVPTFRSRPIRLVLNLGVALFCVNLIFLVGIDRTSNALGCRVIAALLYFFLLAAFAWMTIIADNLRFMFITLIGNATRTKIYVLLGWGLPLVITGILVGIDSALNSPIGFGDANRCWISTTWGLYGAFLIPVGILLMVNITIFVFVTVKLTDVTFGKMSKSAATKQKRRATQQVVLFGGIVACLGLAWVFAYLAMVGGGVVFWYLFVLFNTTQGVFLCVFFVLSGRTREELLRRVQDKVRDMRTRILQGSSRSSIDSTLSRSLSTQRTVAGSNMYRKPKTRRASESGLALEPLHSHVSGASLSELNLSTSGSEMNLLNSSIPFDIAYPMENVVEEGAVEYAGLHELEVELDLRMRSEQGSLPPIVADDDHAAAQAVRRRSSYRLDEAPSHDAWIAGDFEPANSMFY